MRASSSRTPDSRIISKSSALCASGSNGVIVGNVIRGIVDVPGRGAARNEPLDDLLRDPADDPLAPGMKRHPRADHRRGRRAAQEAVALDERRAGAAARRRERGGAAGIPAADDQHVARLAPRSRHGELDSRTPPADLLAPRPRLPVQGLQRFEQDAWIVRAVRERASPTASTRRSVCRDRARAPTTSNRTLYPRSSTRSSRRHRRSRR